MAGSLSSVGRTFSVERLSGGTMGRSRGPLGGAALSLLLSSLALPGEAVDLAPAFEGQGGAFVLKALHGERVDRFNEKRCAERASPFSTFKIPNALIGLETGVLQDADTRIPWDSAKYPRSTLPDPSHWARDQTLRSAVRYSVVWYFREMALRVGDAAMKKYVQNFHYGNEDISGGLDRFWLGSSLMISPDEQVSFLERFYQGLLPVSARSVAIVKDIITLERTPQYTLSGKTGGGKQGETYLGWFVGYLETKGDVYFFATQLDGATFASIESARLAVTKRLLSRLGLLPLEVSSTP
jgi:beta-lactamase class D